MTARREGSRSGRDTRRLATFSREGIAERRTNRGAALWTANMGHVARIRGSRGEPGGAGMRVIDRPLYGRHYKAFNEWSRTADKPVHDRLYRGIVVGPDVTFRRGQRITTDRLQSWSTDEKVGRKHLGSTGYTRRRARRIESSRPVLLIAQGARALPVSERARAGRRPGLVVPALSESLMSDNLVVTRRQTKDGVDTVWLRPTGKSQVFKGSRWRTALNAKARTYQAVKDYIATPGPGSVRRPTLDELKRQRAGRLNDWTREVEARTRAVAAARDRVGVARTEDRAAALDRRRKLREMRAGPAKPPRPHSRRTGWEKTLNPDPGDPLVESRYRQAGSLGRLGGSYDHALVGNVMTPTQRSLERLNDQTKIVGIRQPIDLGMPTMPVRRTPPASPAASENRRPGWRTAAYVAAPPVVAGGGYMAWRSRRNAVEKALRLPSSKTRKRAAAGLTIASTAGGFAWHRRQEEPKVRIVTRSYY